MNIIKNTKKGCAHEPDLQRTCKGMVPSSERGEITDIVQEYATQILDYESTISQIAQEITDFQKNFPHGIVVFWGATATGKSSMAIAVSHILERTGVHAEIISADSRQIFRYMDIGTDKVPLSTRTILPHYQIDICDPDGFYTAGEWKRDAEHCIRRIQGKGNIPFVVGGTGLYIDTLYKNYAVPEVQPDFVLRAKWDEQEEQDPGFLRKKLLAIDPDEAAKHHANSRRYIIRALEIYEKTGKPKSEIAKEQSVQRPILMIGLRRTKEDSNQKIVARIDDMFENGLVDEVKSLLAMGYRPDLQSMQGIGYKEIIPYCTGETTLVEAKKQLILHTQQYAKRQRTWFRRYIADAMHNPKENVIYRVFRLTK